MKTSLAPPPDLIHDEGQIYYNRKPVFRKPKFKCDIMGLNSIYVQGHCIRKTYLQTYLYGFGDDQVFDIREFRELAGFRKKEYRSDVDHLCAALHFVVRQINQVAEKQDLAEFLKPILHPNKPY